MKVKAIEDIANDDTKNKKKPSVFLTTSSFMDCLPIRTGINARECNILLVSEAAYLTSTITLIIFIPPPVDPPIAPTNIKERRTACVKKGHSS